MIVWDYVAKKTISCKKNDFNFEMVRELLENCKSFAEIYWY